MRNIRLQKRDHAILEHIGRYRLTTTQVLHRLFFDGLSANAVKSTRRRLQEAGYIQSADLFGNQSYFYLTKKAAILVAAENYFSEPLGEQALPEYFGVLSFCCVNGNDREALSRTEFVEAFPELATQHVPRWPYFIDDDSGHKRLGFVVVNQQRGFRAVIRQCRDIIQKRSIVPAFQSLILNDEFLIVIVTSKDGKRYALEQAIERRPLAVKVSVEVVPDLVHLV